MCLNLNLNDGLKLKMGLLYIYQLKAILSIYFIIIGKIGISISISEGKDRNIYIDKILAIAFYPVISDAMGLYQLISH